MKKYFNKQTIIAFMFGAFLFSAISLYAVEGLNISVNPYPIIKNGEEVKTEGYNINGSTYLKTRDVASLVGTNVEFKDNKIYIGGSEDNTKPTLIPIDYKGCKAIKYNDNIYVPLAELRDVLGYKNISYDFKTNIATIPELNLKIQVDHNKQYTNDYIINNSGNACVNTKLLEK